MSRLGPFLWCAAVVAFFCELSIADEVSPGFSQAAIHDPFSPRYVPLTPVAGGIRTFSVGNLWGGYTVAYPYFPPNLVAPNLYPYGPFMEMYYRPVVYRAVPPPTPPFAPIGVQAAGLDGGAGGQPAGRAAPGAVVQALNAGFGDLAATEAAPQPRLGKARATNAEARARSQRFIVLGDRHFAKQAYSDAYSRYKLAQQAAPDMGDGFLRQGFALTAMGRYENAAKNLKRGIALAPNWINSGFRLDQLYGANALAKAAHLEALAQQALKGPSSDLLFLLGLMLYCDGQAERAGPFFLRAKELAGGDDAHLDGFLQKLAPANQAPAPAEPVAVAKKPAIAPPKERIAPFSQLPAPTGNAARRATSPLTTAPSATLPAAKVPPKTVPAAGAQPRKEPVPPRTAAPQARDL
ncbi:MAG TPA: hypothetical protein VGN12_17590 [Pirellulales bacterium]|jgi:hypothetical protein